jgi:hypothetical protein
MPGGGGECSAQYMPPRSADRHGFRDTIVGVEQLEALGGRSLLRVRSTFLATGILVLAGVFLAQHRVELGGGASTTRAFTAAVGQYGIFGLSGAAQSAGGGLAALLVVIAWYGLGDVLLRWTRSTGGAPSRASPRPSRVLDPVRACAFGAGAWSLFWLALGLAGLYRASTALAALGSGLVLAALAIVRSRRTPRTVNEAAATPEAGARSGALLLVLPLTLSFMAALAPPTAKDTLQYHLALPKAYLASGGLVEVPGNIANYFPLGAEMHGVWAMLLGRIVSPRAGEAGFGAVAFAFFPLLLAAVFAWVRDLGLAPAWAWLAAALVAGVPTVCEVAGSGYVDLALALYVTLAIQAGARWCVTLDRTNLAGATLALGFALAVKLTAAFVVLILGVILLLRARGVPEGTPDHRRLGAGLAALAGAVTLGFPWYLRTWMHTGSPVFPFFANVWPGRAPDWDLERSAMLHGFNALYGGAEGGPLGYLLSPLWGSLMGQREVAALYEGVLGVSFLIGAALILWALARGVLGTEMKIAAAAGGVLFVWWLASAQVLRYLLPALPLLAVSSVGAGAALTAAGAVGRSLRWALAASVMAGEAIFVNWAASDNPVLAATGAEPRAAYLERRLDYYPYYRLINESLPPKVKIWLVDMRRDTYHLERPYVGDYLFEDYTLRRWVAEGFSGRDLRQRALAAGITHVLIRHDILLDYAHSPLVDDGRPRGENLSRLNRLRSFLAEGTRVLRADRKFALVELVPSNPQASK